MATHALLTNDKQKQEESIRVFSTRLQAHQIKLKKMNETKSKQIIKVLNTTYKTKM